MSPLSMNATTILLPLDFSRVSRFVIAQGIKLARATQGNLVLLHVVQPPAVVSDYGPFVESVIQLTAQFEKTAARTLARLQRRMEKEGLRSEVILETGHPVDHILEQARRVSASYIVMGSHGHTALFDLFVGSTTNGVLKKSGCPVLVVPMPLKAKQAVKGKIDLSSAKNVIPRAGRSLVEAGTALL